MTGRSDLVDVDDVVLVMDTEKAFLFRTANGEKVWIPKSQCEWDGSVLTLRESLAVDKGLV